jgi:hypothetical protein
MSDTDKTSASPDAGYSSHNEQEKMAQDPEPKLVDAPARRQSVALNIVENPLKVSFASQSQPGELALTRFTLTAQLQRADHRQCPKLCRGARYG